MLILHEDSKKTLKRSVHLPDKFVEKLKRLRKAYGDKYLKNAKGGKILIQNTNDTEYNVKDDNDVNGKNKNSHDIPIGVAKERLKMQNACQPNSLQDVLMGGEEMKHLLQTGIKSARSAVKPTEKVPEVPKLDKSTPDVKDYEPQKVDLPAGQVTIVKEGKSIFISEEQLSVLQNII